MQGYGKVSITPQVRYADAHGSGTADNRARRALVGQTPLIDRNWGQPKFDFRLVIHTLAVPMFLLTMFIHAHIEGRDHSKPRSRKGEPPWPGAHHQMLVCLSQSDEARFANHHCYMHDLERTPHLPNGLTFLIHILQPKPRGATQPTQARSINLHALRAPIILRFIPSSKYS